MTDLFRTTMQKALWEVRNQVLEEAATVNEFEASQCGNKFAAIFLKRAAEKIRLRKVDVNNPVKEERQVKGEKPKAG